MSEPVNLVLFGAGGHAKVIIDIIERRGEYRIAGVLDDAGRKGESFFGYPVLGTRADIPSLISAQLRHALVSIGDNASRAAVAALFAKHGWAFATAVHPQASVGRGAIISPGSVVMAGCVVNADAFVGNHAVINTGATVDHDCRIGEAVHLAPGCHLCGRVTVGNGSFLGTGTSVVPGISIGDGVIVGAGSAVIGNIPAGLKVAGVPARSIA